MCELGFVFRECLDEFSVQRVCEFNLVYRECELGFVFREFVR